MSETTGQKTPPVGRRFRKGASGNPKGRPKKPAPKSVRPAFDILFDRTLTVTRNGVSREATVEEALLHRTYQDAIAGNHSAIKEILKMIGKRDAMLFKKIKPDPLKVVIEPVDPQNANAALLLLGIVSHGDSLAIDGEGGRLVLEPWAVQLALNRRRGGKRLTEKDLAWVKASTRGASDLRWPGGMSE